MAIWVTPKLTSLPDVGVSTPNDGDVLTWDAASSKWVNDAAAGGVTDHGALSGLSDDDHTGYLLATGSRTGASAAAQAFTSGITIGPSTQTITFNNTNVANALLGSIDFKNNNNVVARIAIDERSSVGVSYGGYDDADMIFSTALNGSLTERFRIPRTGEITFPYSIYLGGLNGWINCDANGAMQIGARIGTAFYSALYSRNYAYFNRNDVCYISPFRSDTNTVFTMLDLRSNTSGTPVAGYGVGLALELESSTTEDQSAARIVAVWNDATHATRKADLVLTAYDTAEREGLRIRGAGSAAAIGFLGATPAARVAHVADPSDGTTVDAEARSAINAILSTLEAFGFHATS